MTTKYMMVMTPKTIPPAMPPAIIMMIANAIMNIPPRISIA